MGLLCGRAGRLRAKNGGFRPGQCAAEAAASAPPAASPPPAVARRLFQLEVDVEAAPAPEVEFMPAVRHLAFGRAGVRVAWLAW